MRIIKGKKYRALLAYRIFRKRGSYETDQFISFLPPSKRFQEIQANVIPKSARRILPCHPNLVTSYTEYPSSKRAGILPSELARTKLPADIFPMAAANVMRPEGTNGSNRRES